MSTSKKSPTPKNKPAKIVRDAHGHFAKKSVKGAHSVKNKTVHDKRSEMSNKNPSSSVEGCWNSFFGDFEVRMPFDERRRVAQKLNPSQASQTQEDAPLAANVILYHLCKDVVEKNPHVLEINGKKFYSEGKVAQMIAETITTCAETASKEIANHTTDKNPASKGKPPSDDTEGRWSRILATCIMSLFCGSLLAAAIVGMSKIWQWFAR